MSKSAIYSPTVDSMSFVAGHSGR